jgi:hypothetical protein
VVLPRSPQSGEPRCRSCAALATLTPALGAAILHTHCREGHLLETMAHSPVLDCGTWTGT